jgi:hypothetical protein
VATEAVERLGLVEFLQAVLLFVFIGKIYTQGSLVVTRLERIREAILQTPGLKCARN